MSVDTSTDPNPVESLVLRYWGFSQVRPLQKEAIDAVTAGRDALVIMGTGGGKSLCYQAAALCLPGTTVVLSPLIALMKDQVDTLCQLGIPAACLHSASTSEERWTIRKKAREGSIKLLYVAPERLMGPDFIEWLHQEVPVSLLAVDEAHCISTWGHDFRPEYRQFSVLRNSLTNIPVLACTATATPIVADDIVAQLGMIDPARIQGSFDRKNLFYRVLPLKDSVGRILKIVERHGSQPGLIYCPSRAKTEQLAGELQARGVKALPYHAGLDDSVRHANQESFLEGTTQVMVATVAFGMGIDKPNIRFVVHWGIPESLENYQQESGRAGRDGLPSECTLLFGWAEVIMWRKRIKELPSSLQKTMEKRLQAIINYCESSQCRRATILHYFGEHSAEACSGCDICHPDRSPEDQPVARKKRTSSSPAPRFSAKEPIPETWQIPEKILSHFARLKSPQPWKWILAGLLGRPLPTILALDHHSLSTFGILKAHPEDLVNHWMAELRDGHCIEIDAEKESSEEPHWKLTDTGRETMRGKSKILLTFLPRGGGQTDETSDATDSLFQNLRIWRRTEAERQGVGAYIIFHDSALRTIAQTRPSSMQELAELPGVGQKRAERYGSEVLGICKAVRNCSGGAR